MRLATNASRTFDFSTALAPYGERYASYTPSGGAAVGVFTGQPQDTTYPLYDFPLRRYDQTQGRWISPDPAGLAAVDITSPQTWNRYAYVGNNPMILIDPSGLCPQGQAAPCAPTYQPSTCDNIACPAQNPLTGGGVVFGLDEFDFGEAGLLPTGLPFDASSCSPQYPSCAQTLWGTLGLDLSGEPVGLIGSFAGPGGLFPTPESGLFGAELDFLFSFGDFSDSGSGGEGNGGTTGCQAKILGSFNAQFGTSASLSQVQGLGAPQFGNVTINIAIYFPVGSLGPGQVMPGRFGGGPLGVGSTLHVVSFSVGQNIFLPGMLADIAVAHLDEGNPDIFPFGTISHLNYVLTHSAGPCP